MRQVAEVQALQAVFWEPGAVRLSAAESEAFLLAQAIVDGSLPQPVEALGDLCLSGTVFIVGTELHGGPVGLRFVLPPSYPSEVAQLTVECSAPRALHERLCDVVRAVAAATVGEESLLLAAEALKDAANDAATCAAAAGNRTGTAAAASPAAASDSEDELGHSAVSQEEQFSASSAACSTGTGETRAMGGPRAGDGGSRSCGYCATLVWFHHILSSTKKRCLVLWARELGVSGYCKPGYPGE